MGQLFVPVVKCKHSTYSKAFQASADIKTIQIEALIGPIASIFYSTSKLAILASRAFSKAGSFPGLAAQ